MSQGKNLEKIEAAHLIINKGLSQKEVSQILKVSENSISTWAIKYDWKKKKQERVEKLQHEKIVLKGFLSYIKDVSPELHKQVKELEKNYINTISI